MRRRLVVALLLCLATLFAAAQGEARVYRIGFLWLGDADGSTPEGLEALRAGLRELGYVEDRNLQIETRDAAGRTDKLDAAAAGLVALTPDAIVTSGTAATLAAKRATGTIPIVFGGAADPVGRGIVASLAHPGGNVTGFAIELAEAKSLEILQQIAPRVRRLGLLYHTRNMPPDYFPVFVAEHQRAAEALEMTVVPQGVAEAGDIAAAFAAMAASRVDAVLILGDQFLIDQRNPVMAQALGHRLPTACLSRLLVADGCLFSYTEADDRYQRAAVAVDKILKGVPPGDIPVEHGAQFALTVNLQTAKALGLTVPPAILARAGEVIE